MTMPDTPIPHDPAAIQYAVEDHREAMSSILAWPDIGDIEGRMTERGGRRMDSFVENAREAFDVVLRSASPTLDPAAIRAAGFAEGLEAAAKWHDEQIDGGHCGEAMDEQIARRRFNAHHRQSAAAIRARASTPADAPNRPGSGDRVGQVTGGVIRTAAGETVLGYEVAAYRETHPQYGDRFGHSYSEHWSTPNRRHPDVKVDRLFTEEQLRAALASDREAELVAEVERLRAKNVELGEQLRYANGTCDLAMKHRDEAEARVKVLEEALRPFAKAGELFGPRLSGDYDQLIYGPAAGDAYCISGDHLRRARAALEPKEGSRG